MAESVPGRLCERRALGRYGRVGTTGSEGTGRAAGEVKSFCEVPARAAGPARPLPPTGMLRQRAGGWSPTVPGPTFAVSSHPGAHNATQTSPRQRLAQGHPAVADLGGPERLEISPCPSAGLSRAPGGRGLTASGSSPDREDERRPDFADISIYLCVSPVLLSVVTCCHLPFLPLNPALSTL